MKRNTKNFHVSARLILVSVLFLGCYLNLKAQTTSQNYVCTREPRRAVTTETKLDLLTSNKDSVMSTIQYIDGLGRPLQSVQMQASPLAKDIVQQIVYDTYGREAVKYLPFAHSGTANGAFKTDAAAKQLAFYNPPGSTGEQQTNGVVRTVKPFAETGFEPSPLNRVFEQAAPGDAWQLPVAGTGNAGSAGNTVRTVYATNDQLNFNPAVTSNNPGNHKVAKFDVTIFPDHSRRLSRINNIATYNSGLLYLTITRDENWKPGDGCIGTIEEFKDRNDRVILKRSYNLKDGAIEQISTYYVYDDYGNLCFVITQLANPDVSSAISSGLLSRYCYQYRYDQRNRLIQKKLPGKGWEYIVYNKLDQAVATQDSVQRMKTPQEWGITRYDALGRGVITGIYRHTGSTAGVNTRADIQTLVNGQAAQWETRIATGDGYTISTWPAALATTLSVNYYDAYTDIPGLPAAYNQQGNPKYSKMLIGLLTASKTNVLGSTDMLWTVPYYDNEARTVSTYKQHYLGGTASYSVYNYDIDSTLYNFNDQPTRLIHRHYVKNIAGTGASLQLTGTNYYSYDHMGRKKRVQHQVRHSTGSSQAAIILSNMDYNEIGQLKVKKMHSINSGSNYLQAVDYRYNPRGWLSSINNAGLTNDGGITNSDTNDQFGMELSYDNSAKPQYNGNIGTIKWKSGPVGGVAQPQYAYDYGYDRINRMTDAVSATAGVKNANYSEYLKYDAMGNITSLGRWDVVSSARTQIDSLTYTYLGNRHTRIDDAATYTGPAGFTNGVEVDNEYTYDGNGNVLKDLNKGISSISYNVLNLPQTLTISSNTLSYTYDATGNKLRKVFTIGAATTTTDYINGVQYTNGAIEFMQTEEGRARKSGTSYLYEYDLYDHLGNSRVTLKPDTADATQLTPLVLQQNSYYPFGAAIRSLEPVVANPKNEYLYNGKELQEETGLYDYGARFYDPVIARWGSVDPLAEKMRRYSPYNYGFNNPVRFVDPDGMVPLTDYYGSGGNYLGTDQVANGKVKIALTASTEQAIASSITNGKVTINEGSYSDLISNPTANEFSTMDKSYATMEANGMNEQGFAVGNNSKGVQSIQTVSSTSNTGVKTGIAVAALAKSGNSVSYDGHTHGAVIKFDATSGKVSVGGIGSSAGDRGGSVYGQPNVVLGYDVQNNVSKITAADVANAQNNPGKFMPLAPGNFSKTITFYNQGGDIKFMNYNTFKTTSSYINIQNVARHIPKLNFAK